MDAGQTLMRQLSEKEAQAWRNLPPAEYDRALCGMLDQINAAPRSAERVDTLIALASVTLRRNSPTLTESRARCAEHLLALVSAVSEPAVHSRIRLLFLLAWLQLGAVVERGPDSVAMNPDLPAGVTFPYGVDPDVITDPVLREEARELAERHGEEVTRWNARQRALGHLHYLASLLRATRPGFRDDKDAAKELAAAMSLTPGLPPELRRLLENETE